MASPAPSKLLVAVLSPTFPSAPFLHYLAIDHHCLRAKRAIFWFRRRAARALFSNAVMHLPITVEVMVRQKIVL
jgi:hypothetical protein